MLLGPNASCRPHLFGSGLVGLTYAPEFMPNSDTYGARQLGSITTPAAVVEGFRLTL